MPTRQYYCKNKKRLQAVRDHAKLNGIDYLEVLDLEAPAGSPRQQTLLVRCVKPVPDGLNVKIRGGVRVTPVSVLWAFPWAFPAPAIPAGLISPQEGAFFSSLSEPDHVLVVRTDSRGDFSIYRLFLTASATSLNPPADFDPILSQVDFSFKVECPSEFDCKVDLVCPPERLSEPLINYLAKDYASFRQLMLDRMAVIMPDWQERNPADVGVALVEVIAYAADHLSYYQDAVATEAYLGTARQRASVRRHARLLDYPMHDGCNARAWVTIQVESGSMADGAVLPKGTQFLTRITMPRGSISPDQQDKALSSDPEVFESMHDLSLHATHNEMCFHTWGDEQCCLPKGATQATLENRGKCLAELKEGHVLIFEEVRSPLTGKQADAAPEHRHIVRLKRVNPTEDPLFEDAAGVQPLQVVDVEWSSEDALPFPLCLWNVEDVAVPGQRLPVTIARGNVVLVDHGRTISGEKLDEIPTSGHYRPKLEFGPLTQQGYMRDKENRLVPFDPEASANAVFHWEMGDVRPSIEIIQDGRTDLLWQPQRDLLNSNRFAREFVAEIGDESYSTQLRFGDDVLGKKPVYGNTLKATYRIGNGIAGNVGAESIAHLVTNLPGIADVRNPISARGGAEPEPIEQVRLYAPQAFRKQNRAVTEADYAEVTQRHPEVQKAMATLRWTGSWHTMFITVDRKDGFEVDADFEERLRRFLERFRMAGYDLEIDGPRFVPLDIAFAVCVAPGYFKSDVKEALLETFSNTDLPDGRRGFFHPDNFTFSQPVYLSQIVSTAMKVPGIQWVNMDDKPPNLFRRWGEISLNEFTSGVIKIGRLEIARLDNDPNAQENGKIEFFMEGGT